jgi:hypothetical protein
MSPSMLAAGDQQSLAFAQERPPRRKGRAPTAALTLALVACALVALAAVPSFAEEPLTRAADEVAARAHPTVPSAPADKPQTPNPTSVPDSARVAEATQEQSPPPQTNPPEAKAAEPKPGDEKPADGKSADGKPAEAKAAEAKALEAKPAPVVADQISEQPSAPGGTASADTLAPAAKKAAPPQPASKAPSKTSSRRPVRRAMKKAAGKAPPAPPPAPEARRDASGSKTAQAEAASDPKRETAAIPEKERVIRELERTDRVVARSQAKVGVGKNARAVDLLGSAGDFQSDAREAFKLSQYVRAERLTLAARDYADRAARLVGPARDDPDYVAGLLDRTDDALDRANEVLHGGASPPLERRFEALKRDQKDARKDFKEGRVSDAYKGTLAVREGVLALLRDADDLPVPESAAQRAVRGAERVLDHATKEIRASQTPESGRLLRLGSTYLEKARASLARHDYRSALLQAKVVEQHVERAMDAARART